MGETAHFDAHCLRVNGRKVPLVLRSGWTRFNPILICITTVNVALQLRDNIVCCTQIYHLALIVRDGKGDLVVQLFCCPVNV